MAQFIKDTFFGAKAKASSAAGDFADFAATSATAASVQATPIVASNEPLAADRPYTAWYRIWERTTPADFKTEAFILPFIFLAIFVHWWGRRRNKTLARTWAKAHVPLLEKEFSIVGFGGKKRRPTVEDVQSSGLAAATEASSSIVPEEALKEKTAQEYSTYATGRQNVAFAEFKITLLRRYNPVTLFAEWFASLLFESFRAPAERIEAIAVPFDGKEKDLIPTAGVEHSSYDSFGWAVVNKDVMRDLRNDRYDLSLTITKDHAKLPIWTTVMSESAEVTDLMLTSELVGLIEKAGDAFEYLIVTDQPIDKPLKLNEATPRKRVYLSMKLASSYSADAYTKTTPLFSYFLRLPDYLVASARLRPEVSRKIKATREDQVRLLKKADDEEKAEERKIESDKKKKLDRDAKLNALSATEQKKFLEKEKKDAQKKMGKKVKA